MIYDFIAPRHPTQAGMKIGKPHLSWAVNQGFLPPPHSHPQLAGQQRPCASSAGAHEVCVRKRGSVKARPPYC